MFGAPAPGASPFGSTPAPTFGAPATPFGAPAPSAFGAPAPSSTFGAPSAFGAPAAQQSAFGAPAFGATTTTGGGFGAPAAPTAFGAPAAQQSVFGAPSAPAPAFGAAPTTTTAGGLFGAPAPAAGFGAPSSGFGMKPAGGGLFGAAPTPAPATSIFGAPAPSGGLFGAPAPAPATGGLFGASPAPAPAFGTPAPSAFGAPTAFGTPASSPFGSQQQQQAVTSSTPFQPTTKQDGTTSITLHSITALAPYESKSFEELRLEDYMAGNKGSQGQQQQQQSSGFGVSAPAAGGFGAPSTTTTTGGLFGAPAPAAGGGLFGSPAPAAGGGLFGAPAPAAPAFGGFGAATPAPAFGAPAPAAGGLFGTPAAAPKPAGPFGSPAPAPAFGGFGSTAPAAPAFGAPQPAPATGGLFGAPAAPTPATGGLFGAPAPAAGGGLFGAPAPAPKPGLFGSPAPAAGGLFGAPAPAPTTGGLFGAPAPTPASGGLFGAPAVPTTPAAGGGLFGSTATPAPAAGSLFGAPAPAPAGGLFGAPVAAPAGGLFGATPAPAPQPVAIAPVAPTPSADVLLAQQLAAVENQRKAMELSDAWRGNPPSGSKVIASSLYDNPDRGWDSYSTQSSALMSYRAIPRSATKIRPRGFTPLKQSPITANALKNIGSKNGGSPILSPNRFIGSATKALIIKPDSLTPKPKTRLLLTNGIASDKKDASVANLENGRFESPRTLQYPTQDLQSPPATATKSVDSASPPAMNGNASPAHDFYRQVVGSPNDTDVLQTITSPRANGKIVPTLSKPEYKVYPPIQELAAMSEADLAAVSGFKVERHGYGSVEWDGAVDVRGVDLDSVVNIEHKSVDVYHNEEMNGNKPERGSKLNRPAVITIQQVFPSSSSAEAKDKFSKKIVKTTKKLGAEFISYDIDSGTWKFRVGHFSRYGLDDDSDEDSDDEMDTPSLTTLEEDEKNELGGASKLCAPPEDESTAGSVVTDDAFEQLDIAKDEEEMEILQNGENAYAIMTEELVEYADALELQQLEDEQTDEILFFPNEAQDQNAHEILDLPIAPSARVFPSAVSGICSKLACKSGLAQSSSSIDYGLRMRQSFRVGWRPDGSFLHLKPSGGKQILVQSKPMISSDTSNPIHLLKTHQRHSEPVTTEEDDDAPLYLIPDGANLAVQDYVESASSYSLRSTTQKAVWSSFSLIVCLYCDDGLGGGITSTRRLEAVSSCLKRVVADDTSKDISSGLSRGDAYGSIFAALSGGDFDRASSLALDSGNPRLSLMLASSGVTAQSLYHSQLEMWNETGAQSHVPSGLLRIFSLSRGSTDIEQSMFKADRKTYTIDWRRRFGMHLWSCRGQDETDLSAIVKKYRSDVANGIAPSPLPIYETETSAITPHHECVLYQIMCQYTGDETTLANIVSPSSHTKFRHDYTASFHLAASLKAMTGSSLTLNEENLIIDSISCQLIMLGSWEWAVYATLSMIGNKTLSKSAVASRMIRARRIICTFYTSSNDQTARRSFLENLGVPSQWFSTAIAYRSGHEGKVFDYVENLMHFSITEALSAVENIIIPHYILGGESSSNKLMGILHSFACVSDQFPDLWEATVLCKPVYEYLVIAKEVNALSNLSRQELDIRSDRIDDLINAAANLLTILSEYREICHEHAPLAKVPIEMTLAPRHIYIAEICAELSIIQLQLLSLKNGTLFETKNSSGLAFALNAGGLFGSGELPADAGPILRGICGFSS